MSEDVKLLAMEACEKEDCKMEEGACECLEEKLEEKPKPKKKRTRKKKEESVVMERETKQPEKTAPSQTKVKMQKIWGERSHKARKYFPNKVRH